MLKRSRSSISGNTSSLSDLVYCSSGETKWPESAAPPPPPPPQPSPEITTAPMIIESENNNKNNQWEIVPINPPDYSKPSIFSIGSPPRDEPFDQKSIPFCKFLQSCYYCKKFISSSRTIYMYSNFGAFCSVECCGKQMKMDEDLQRMPTSPLMNTNKAKNAWFTEVELEHTKLYYRLDKPGAS